MVLSQDWRSAAVLGTAAIALGVGVVLSPVFALLAMGAVVIVFAGVVFPGSLTRTFVRLLFILLIGYAFGGRVFSHIQVGPVYVGEVVLFTGLLSAITDKRRFLAFRSPLSWLLVMFMLWGALRTIPYIPIYGRDAIRDAAMWGYAIFAFLVAPFFMQSERNVGAVMEKWARLAPYFLLWAPLAWLISRVFIHYLPRNPEDGKPMWLMGSGDAGVHLAGIAVLLLLNLHRSRAGQEEADSAPLSHEWVLWVLWAAGMFTVATDGRAALVTVLMALAVVGLYRPMKIGGKLLLVGSIATVLIMSTVVADLSFAIGHEGKRSISAQQMIDNFKSLTGGGRSDLESTAQWRIVWWKKIINYTVFGPYFWTGKGFGVQLAHDDGIGILRTVRSPHNGHLTILAREGIPGLAIWLLLQGAFGIGILRALLRARRMKDGWWERVNLWILTYWLSFLVNATFGVYLESPQGGIWFWSVFGMGMAAMEIQKQKYGRRASGFEMAARARSPALAVRPSGLAGVPSLSTRQRFS